MSSTIRTFADTVGQLQNPLRIRDLGTRCGAEAEISLLALMTGGCVVTTKVTLFRRSNFEGPIPYDGKLSGSGTLLRIAVLHTATLLGIGFVKANESTEECGDPESRVFVPVGGEIGPEEFLEIYQTAAPKLPAFFLACVSNTGDILPFVTIEASYRPA